MFCQIQKMIKEQGTTHKRKGVVLLEAVFALLLMGMVTYGFAETSAMAFSQQSALKNSDKARQYADLEAEVLKSNGFENLETTGVHDRKTLQPITGQNDGYESTVTLASTVAVTPENSVKVAKIDVFKTGENTPRYSLEVPLSSQSSGGGKGIELDYEDAVNWSFGWSGDFTIPADGMLFVSLYNGNSSSYLRYNEMGWDLYNSSSVNHAGCDAFYIPVKKGHSFSYWHANGASTHSLSATLYPYK